MVLYHLRKAQGALLNANLSSLVQCSYLHGFWISVVAITQIIQVVTSSKTVTEKAAKLVFNQTVLLDWRTVPRADLKTRNQI
ncbi:unnamed protein product [Ixodes persulcatus]